MEIDQDVSYHFGTMSQQSEGSHSWKITNKGRVILSCGLVEPRVVPAQSHRSRMVRKPRSSQVGRPRSIWTGTPRPSEETTGRPQRSETQRRQPSSFTLAVAGKVFPPVIVMPPQMITFGAISNEDTYHQRVAVFSQDRPDMKITDVATSRPAFFATKVVPLTADDCKQLKTKAGYKLDLEIKPGMPLGQFQEELVIKTDHPKRGEVKVSISGNVNGSITVVPERLRMPNVLARAEVPKTSRSWFAAVNPPLRGSRQAGAASRWRSLPNTDNLR